ncbi:MAG: hypothetical protein B6D59_01940 [Campylobacteraceae bacterium 4484_4]|nr:MAG: hypothetical protein B6D59_01940 [Campylobacteraceae bacterium 4484_4]
MFNRFKLHWFFAAYFSLLLTTGCQQSDTGITIKQTSEVSTQIKEVLHSSPSDPSPKQNASLPNPPMLAFYGDPFYNRVLAISVKDDNLSLIKEINTTGENTYTVGMGGIPYEHKVYAITRGSDSIDVIDIQTLKRTNTIPLLHHPRSCAFNEILGIQLVSGTDKAMTSLIDVTRDEVVAVVGENCPTHPRDYGGSNATGHPFWLTPDKFVMLDRAARKIYLYRITQNGSKWRVKCLQALSTPTSVHHIIQRGLDDMNGGISESDLPQDTFYAVAEGAPQHCIPPMLLELKLEGECLKLCRKLPLQSPDIDIKKMGAHHGTFHPDGTHIYIGSAEGHTFVINYHTMAIEKIIPTGKGCGHTTFDPQKNLAIITNHKDRFVTIVDTLDHTKIVDINVSGPSQHGTILQSHTSFLSEDGRYFYAFATDNGIFYQLDLESFTITHTLYTGGTPKQGCILLQ